MGYPKRLLPALLAGLALGAPLAAAAQSTAQASLLAQALDAAATGDWTEAATLAAWTGNPIAKDIVLWTRLRDGAGTWDEYAASSPAIPAGRASPPCAAPASGRCRRGCRPRRSSPSSSSRRRPAPARCGWPRRSRRAGAQAEADAEIVRAWTEFSMTQPERTAMVEGWREVLKPHHRERLDMLLWRGLTSEAEAMLRLVDEDWQKLAQARIATRRDDAGMQYLINSVPARLKDDPGLAYERYRYRVEKGRWQDAEAYLLEKSTSATALGRPEMWMERRANLARQALEDGDVAGAYRIAAQNFGSEGPDYADAEWVAGFIALTRMDDPKRRGRALHPLPGGGGDADQPRAGRLLAGARVRGERRRRGGRERLPHGGEVPDELLRPARRREARPARRTPGWPAGGRRPTGATRPSGSPRW